LETTLYPFEQSLFQRIQNEICVHGAADAPTNNTPGKNVNHKRYIQPTLPGRNVGEIRYSQLIGTGTQQFWVLLLSSITPVT